MEHTHAHSHTQTFVHPAPIPTPPTHLRTQTLVGFIRWKAHETRSRQDQTRVGKIGQDRVRSGKIRQGEDQVARSVLKICSRVIVLKCIGHLWFELRLNCDFFRCTTGKWNIGMLCSHRPVAQLFEFEYTRVSKIIVCLQVHGSHSKSGISVSLFFAKLIL